MRVRKTKWLLVFAGLISLFASVFVAGQKQDGTKSDKRVVAPRGMVKQTGWRIPASDDFTPVDESQHVVIEGVSVQRKTTHLATDEEPLVDVNNNAVKIGAATRNKRLFAVREVNSFEAKGRIFAYAVLLVPVTIANGARAYEGAMYIFYYYDEDGNGTFETRYSALRSPKLARWLRAAGQQPSGAIR